MARSYHPNRQQNAGDRPVYHLGCSIRAAADGPVRIDIFDDIGEGMFTTGITAKSFAEKLEGVRGALDVHVSSCGGDVWDGLAVYSALRDHPAPVTVTVDGIAASIASVIVQGGGTRVMAPGSMLMIHSAFGVCAGDEAEHQKMAEVLEKVSGNLASIYASRAGGSASFWRSQMKSETWYDASEAVAAGLADKVGNKPAVAPADLALAALGTVPGRVAAQLRTMPSAGPEEKVAAFAQRAQSLFGAGPRRRDSGGHPGYAQVREDLRQTGLMRDIDPSPAAQLNGYGWARSLGSFMAAIGDKEDRQGARAVISRVMKEARPRAAAGMAERVPSEGGFLIPERLADQIAVFMSTACVVPRCKPVPMDSLRTPIPLLDNPDQASGMLGGMTFSMVGEGKTIPATVPEFGRLALEARKFMGYLASVPNELVDDAPAFSEQFLPEIVGRGLAWQEDFLAVNGSGVGEPQGLLNAPAALTQVRTASDTVEVVDLVGMLKQLHPQSKRSGTTCWLVGDDLFGVLLDLATVTGAATEGVSAPSLWLTYDAAHGYWCLLGYPCFPTDLQPALGSTGDAILVDLSLYLWGTRGEMTVERSQKGSGFPSNTSNFRFRHRIDGRLWPQNSYTLSNSQVVSPLVILEVAA